MTTLDLSELRRKALAATPDVSPEMGDDYGWHRWDCPEQKFQGVAAFEFGPSHFPELTADLYPWRVANCPRKEDADYIVAAKPSVVLALLDRLEEAEAALRGLLDNGLGWAGRGVNLGKSWSEYQVDDGAIAEARAYFEKRKDRP